MSTESLRARLAAATVGPWRKVRSSPISLNVYSGDDLVSELIASRSDMDPEANADLITYAPADLAAALKVIDAFTVNDRQILTTAKEWCGEYGFGDPEGCTVIWNLIEQANATLDAFEALP